jgi:LuxR family maltose regulon positive regulatory protein
MNVPLLKTKLYLPPIRSELVARPRLLVRLRNALDAGHKLTLISAPAGFGKSTLLSDCASKCGVPVGWLSLDEDDNDVSRFWTYVVAALQTALRTDTETEFGQETVELLQLPQSPHTPTILTTLLNELADLPTQVILVLDDYHVIHTPAIHEGLAFLLDHQPPQLHLALSTRADPPLPLARLRARRRLTEIRANDLRFTVAETMTLLNEVLHLNLSPENVTTLEERTEGWIVGLQLAALALQNCADSSAFVSDFTGTHHYILEYLTEEVLHRQSPEVQAFLLRTSILERLNGALCDAVLSTSEIQNRMLQQLHATNLFLVPLDDERQWYRYHHLFADLLNNQLRQTLSVEEIQTLHLRASAWYEANGDTHDAIKHASQAQDWLRVADLVECAFTATVSGGGVTTLLRWSDALPEEIIRTRPRLCMYRGWALFLNGQYAQCERALHCADEALRVFPVSPEIDILRGELSAFLATVATIHQDVPEATKQARLALRYLPEAYLSARARALRALGIVYGLQSETDKLIEVCEEAKSLAITGNNILLASEVMSQIAYMRYHKGQLRQSAQVYQEILDLVPQPQKFPPAGLGYIGLALVALEWNDLAAVENYLRLGITLSRQGGIGYMLRTAFCIQAIHKQALGDEEGVAAAIQAAHQLPWLPGVSDIPVLLLQYRVRLHLLRGEVDIAAQWVTGAAFDKPVVLSALPAILDEIVQYSQARVALQQGDVVRTLAICDTMIPQAQAAGRLAHVIELTLLKSLALYAQAEPESALEALAQCLALAEPAGYMRLFFEAGEPLPALLKLAVEHGIQPDYASTLLAALGHPATVSQPLSPLVEPLTMRELEILRLICAGLSNQAIAETLVVSLNTVKKHSSNLYDKLGVQSRTQAVARAQALELL